MYTEQRNLTWALSLLLLSGVLSNGWKVEYQQSVCAVKGSSVVIPCSFSYPDQEQVQEVKWGHERNSIYEGPFIFDSASHNSSSRFEYIGDTIHNCSLKINQVEQNDEGKYAFRLVTKKEEWTGAEGSKLKIVDLTTVVKNTNGHREIKEGDSVSVTCRNSCDGSGVSSAFIWFKNGRYIDVGPSLNWTNISPSNSGNYNCSLKAHVGTTSGVVNINVEYAPKNTSVSVRPSTEVDVGSGVVFTCSGHANPPVESYTWFKVDDDEAHKTVSKSVLHLSEVSPAEAGRYFCSASNRHGSQNSTIVTLKVKAHFPYALIISIAAAAAAALLIVAAVVVGVRRFNDKRTRGPEADPVGDQQIALSNTVYLNWPIPGHSHEGNGCEGEKTETVYATIDFNAKRKSNMLQQMDSGSTDDWTMVIYSLVQLPGRESPEPFTR